MRVLYIDIDTLRPDHLGCYGYHRDTSPNIDRMAAEGVRLDRCYASDTPCLPSRSALTTLRFGIHNGVVGHGGTAADPFIEGPERRFYSRLFVTSFAGRLFGAGLETATLSSFAQRHSAFHWYAGFQQAMLVPGSFGNERADEVEPLALDWLERNGKRDGWFLHVHLWDPHTPYRTPAGYGEPFADEPCPSWLTEEVRARDWESYGPYGARETVGFDVDPERLNRYPRQPIEIDSMDAVRKMFDGYDTGIRYADDTVGRLLDRLEGLGVLDDTAVVISSDHGETLGELGVYGDHHAADEYTSRVPMIIRWPGLGEANRGRVDAAFHYQIDVAATLVELAGGRLSANWDGQSFAEAFRQGRDEGRDALILSHGAWSCQRSVRFEDTICIRTYHDGYHPFPDVMLFDLASDPHEQVNLAEEQPAVVQAALGQLEAWHAEMMRSSSQATDPMQTVLREGGPWHVRGQLPAYLERLRNTGRGHWADQLQEKYADDLSSGPTAR
jgi:choline-sulfatase